MDHDEISPDEKVTMLDRLASQLLEHFDSVQIFVTSHKADETEAIATGEGNFLTRYGQIREWVLKVEASIKRQDRRRREDDEEEVG